MDRRESLGLLFGKPKTTSKSKSTIKKTISAFAGLEPYTGPWTVVQAGHLMRRTTFGPSQEMVDQALAMGMNSSVNLLFDNAKPYDPPIKYTLDEADPENDFLAVLVEPVVAYGETWVNEPPLINYGLGTTDTLILISRFQSMTGWVYRNMYEDGMSIMAKMFMFWHNHFVVSDFRLPLEAYSYSNTLLENAIGNFKELTKQITVEPAMLRYLNGNENTRQAPNENYSRELLELFTVGKGDLAGPGDYTTFTEDDVVAMSKILTGWVINLFVINESLESTYVPGRHTQGSKQLSARFNNAVIDFAGDNEYKNLIDVIFEQDVVSLFICRKLYRYFLNYEITEEIELNVIQPMAQILRDHNYEIRPALEALLKSAHFYSQEAIGCMIKNPLDFILSMTRSIGFSFPADYVAVTYVFSIVFDRFGAEMEMSPFNHPDVAGWKAYYQGPQYYRIWINTFLLPKRNEASRAFIQGGNVQINNNTSGIPPLIPVIEFIAGLEDSYDPNLMIQSIADKLFPYPITEAQRNYLKEILIPGLLDYEWTVEYSEFLADPENEQLLNSITRKLQTLLVAMTEMPEFQLM